MIASLTFIRHGQTQANAEGIYSGSQPHVQLTEHDREEALAAGRMLVGRQIDVIIASPYDRAQMTAHLIASVIGYNPDEIVTDDDIKEFDDGLLTGQKDRGFPAYLEYVLSGVDPTAETPMMVTTRARHFLKMLVKQYDNQHILAVAHAGTGRVLRSLLTGVPLEEIAKLDMPNADPLQLPLDRIEELIS